VTGGCRLQSGRGIKFFTIKRLGIGEVGKNILAKTLIGKGYHIRRIKSNGNKPGIFVAANRLKFNTPTAVNKNFAGI
jgi:hypothetical protein